MVAMWYTWRDHDCTPRPHACCACSFLLTGFMISNSQRHWKRGPPFIISYFFFLLLDIKSAWHTFLSSSSSSHSSTAFRSVAIQGLKKKKKATGAVRFGISSKGKGHYKIVDALYFLNPKKRSHPPPRIKMWVLIHHTPFSILSPKHSLGTSDTQRASKCLLRNQ